MSKRPRERVDTGADDSGAELSKKPRDTENPGSDDYGFVDDPGAESSKKPRDTENPGADDSGVVDDSGAEPFKRPRDTENLRADDSGVVDDSGAEPSKKPRDTENPIADDCDDPYEEIIVGKISDKKRITVRSWLGKVVVDIREFCVRKGKERPCETGISLTHNQWKKLCESVNVIDKAVAEYKLNGEEVE